jgi:hypothetical protein
MKIYLSDRACIDMFSSEITFFAEGFGAGPRPEPGCGGGAARKYSHLYWGAEPLTKSILGALIRKNML